VAQNVVLAAIVEPVARTSYTDDQTAHISSRWNCTRRPCAPPAAQTALTCTTTHPLFTGRIGLAAGITGHLQRARHRDKL